MAEWLAASGELIGAAGPDPGPEHALSGKELRRSIDDAIATLDPTEQSVIRLAYDGGLTQAEIAERLGWPLGTVKTRTRRALGRLREVLERTAGDVQPGAVAEGPARSGAGPARPAARPKRPERPARPTGRLAATATTRPAPCAFPC